MANNLSKLSDEDLLILHKESGESNCVKVLFNRYLTLIYGVCLSYLKDADSAEDAVMQIYNNLLGKLADYEITAFRPWIYDFTKNYCFQLQGKEINPVEADFGESAAKFDKVISLFQSNDDKQVALRENCLSELKQEQRVCINYFFKDKLSYAEIVDKSGYTLKHVKNCIKRGNHNLLTCIEKNKE